MTPTLLSSSHETRQIPARFTKVWTIFLTEFPPVSVVNGRSKRNPGRKAGRLSEQDRRKLRQKHVGRVVLLSTDRDQVDTFRDFERGTWPLRLTNPPIGISGASPRSAPPATGSG